MNDETRPVNPGEEEFADSIPAPEDVSASEKPHKIVRVVETNEEKPKKGSDKKGFIGEFFAGAAAGAKTLGENISSGVKNAAPKAEKVPHSTVDEEISFGDEKKSANIKDKFFGLPTKAVIGGAAALIAVLITVILCAASCNKPEKPEPLPSESESHQEVIIEPETETEPEEKPIIISTRTDKVVAANANNSDVVGWLYVPGLSEVDGGVCFHKSSKWYYNKRDINGKSTNKWWINGVYYTHYENTFGEDASAFSTNTIIFGHSDLGKENYVFEVFSVFYNDSKIDGGKSLWYIKPEPGSNYQNNLDIIRERSLYDYDVEVTTNDKILTLSTCTVGFGLPKRSNYRFVIVAKLVPEGEEPILKNASFTINDEAPVPSSYAEEFKGYVENWKPSETVITTQPQPKQEGNAA
ncbi:MAG: class B sortase [Clostridia bacterium]|nr:class B sortase [Clostridia bacterium]